MIETISAASFPTISTGFVIVQRCLEGTASCTTRLLTTVDSGTTWTDASPRGALPGDSYTRELAFADEQTGWLYGLGLYVTHDAGRSWSEVPIDPGLEVRSVHPAGSTVWAEAHFSTQCDRPTTCELDGIYKGPISGRSIHRVSTQPLRAFRNLVRATPAVAYASGQAWSPDGSALRRTDDGGASWHDVVLPCGAQEFFLAVAAPSRDVVWLACQEEPAGSFQDRTIWRSVDRGRHWLRASDSQVVSGSSLSEFYAFDATRAVVGISKTGKLMMTRDAGRLWTTILQPGGDAGLTLSAPSKAHLWVLNVEGLRHSSDGGRTWRMALPPE